METFPSEGFCDKQATVVWDVKVSVSRDNFIKFSYAAVLTSLRTGYMCSQKYTRRSSLGHDIILPNYFTQPSGHTYRMAVAVFFYLSTRNFDTVLSVCTRTYGIVILHKNKQNYIPEWLYGGA